MAMPRAARRMGTVTTAFLIIAAAPSTGQGFTQAPGLAALVAAGELPSVEQRLPDVPRIVELDTPGHYGGDLRTVMGRNQDIRLMTVYGYARLAGYTPQLTLAPDILRAVDVEDERVFTFRLRPGHKWSDGHPFTTEDFRYWWEDMANDDLLSPFGPPAFVLVDDVAPTVEVIDAQTIRYSWPSANPFFLPQLAAPRPGFIYRPAHYLRQFHVKYADPDALQLLVQQSRRRDWGALHNSLDNLYDNDNPDLPTLQPWVNTVQPPSQRYVFERNPYFHRVDSAGQQLPYIDRVLVTIADGSLIPAKAAFGETDLQARGLALDHFTLLKEAEDSEAIRTLLWKTGQGAQAALYPNLNHQDPVWRSLFRDVRFRRALSVAIDREEINQVLYLGMATPSNNTVLAESPLFAESYQTNWTQFDPDLANALLDEIGLSERNDQGVRLLPDGRPLEIVVETTGEVPTQSDVLQLIYDTWRDIGIELFVRPVQREVFRNRVFAGETQVAMWFGIDNGIPTANVSPEELAPVQQIQLQWPKWGQYYETDGQAGEPVDMELAQQLLELNDAWRHAGAEAERQRIWHRILQIHADQLFSIGIVCCTPQPIVVSDRLRGIPDTGIYAWEPSAYFGIYMPDTFWFDPQIAN